MSQKKNFIYKKINNSTGYFHNPSFTTTIPVVNNIPYYNERDLFLEEVLKKKCTDILEATVGYEKEYERFVRQKNRRPTYDIYACFQSFNEAFKAFFPFIKILQKQLNKDDLILNLWDRTGWNGAILQGLFPEQKVITLWEGDKDILGYKGFHFWHGRAEETSMQIAFADLNQALPFDDESIAFVFGLDTLHRFNLSLLLEELLRVCQKGAPIIFPHVHLTNNEPIPFFERGCRQLHGLDYDSFFKKMLGHTGRKGYIFPEPEMFTFNEFELGKTKPIISSPDTSHYNALIAILPKSWEQTENLAPFQFTDLPNLETCYVLVNSLVDIDYSTQQTVVNREKMENRVGYLLDRHPIYLEKLNKANNFSLTEVQLLALYYAEKLLSIKEITEKLRISIDELTIELVSLVERDIIQILPVKQQAIRLQKYVSTQQYVLPPKEQTINALWDRAVQHFTENTFLISEQDDSEFSYEDCGEIIQQIQHKLAQTGLKKGDAVGIISANNFEAILTILASIQLGLVAIPIDHTLPLSMIDYILQATNPSLLFLDDKFYNRGAKRLDKHQLIIFDGLEEEEQSTLNYFSEWLSEEIEDSALSIPSLVDSDTLAVILYTSGSTGIPKGVMLAHGQLCRSSRLITESFHWKETDRFYTAGELNSMSGLRNTCFAPLEVGAATIIPKIASKENIFTICESIALNQATIIGATPVLLAQMELSKKHLKRQLTTVQQIICTGSNLSLSLKETIQDYFKLPILNYYGLTETTGICITQKKSNNLIAKEGIGKACNCIAQIVNEQGKLLKNGEKGELRIYGDNIMLGYYENQQLTAKVIRNGWFYTGDYAAIQTDGTIQLLGRKRKILKAPDGQLVYPSEFEESLRQHPTVKEVRVGIKIDGGYEKLLLYISLKEMDKQADIRQYLKALIADRNIPFQLIFSTHLLKNVKGEITIPTNFD